MPLVSVIVLVHRNTPFVQVAVDSVLRQTLSDWELLFVDNGSGMKPEDLGPVGRDPRLRWIALPGNLGIPLGMNAGLAAARGEYVAVLDSDDVALPRRFAVQTEFLDTHPEIALVFSAAETINPAGEVTGSWFTLLSGRDHRIFSQYDMPAGTPTFMARREVVQSNPYRECFGVASDYDQFTRITDHHGSCALAEVLTQYRLHPVQVTVQQRPSQVLNACIVRLITARRRAGKPEKLAELLAEVNGWIEVPPDYATLYEFFAARSFEDNFNLLAVYFARKTLAFSRSPARIFAAGRTLLAAMCREPGQIIRLGRMFFTGPLRTFDLRPA
ncbi:MAG: glycosyltransferase [Cephaloticoccus sp.]|nr:glycosyltransferase [Cephaloticoccus sp.]MCF7760664.1 glycosyltransferase [Cephaloticoccus sp.]